MSTEDELRDALAAEAEQVGPAPDAWRRVVEGAAVGERQRRRRLWLGSGMAATGAAVVIALIALVAVRDGGDDEGLRTVDTAPTTTAVTTAPSTTLTSLPPISLPQTVIGYSNKGRLVELNTRTGEAVRTLASFKYTPENWPRLGHVSVSPDNGTVFYDAEDGVWSVPRAGGTPTRIGAGRLPVVSWDGKTLAYVRTTFGDDLVLRDLTTGKERVIPRGEDYPPDNFFSMSWDAGSRKIYANWMWEDTEGLLEIDTATARSLKDGRAVKYPDADVNGDTFRLHQHIAHDTFVAVHTCCAKDSSDGMMEWDHQWTRLAYVGDNRFDGDRLDIPNREVTALDVGADTTFAYVVDNKELWVWDRVAPPRLLAFDFVGAAFPPGVATP